MAISSGNTVFPSKEDANCPIIYMLATFKFYSLRNDTRGAVFKSVLLKQIQVSIALMSTLIGGEAVCMLNGECVVTILASVRLVFTFYTFFGFFNTRFLLRWGHCRCQWNDRGHVFGG